jgi:hypothetical protein
VVIINYFLIDELISSVSGSLSKSIPLSYCGVGTIAGSILTGEGVSNSSISIYLGSNANSGTCAGTGARAGTGVKTLIGDGAYIGFNKFLNNNGGGSYSNIISLGVALFTKLNGTHSTRHSTLYP